MNDRIKTPLKSNLPDSDMQGSASALLRAAGRAREVAKRTNTAVVVMRDGKLVEERSSEDAGVKSGT